MASSSAVRPLDCAKVSWFWISSTSRVSGTTIFGWSLNSTRKNSSSGLAVWNNAAAARRERQLGSHASADIENQADGHRFVVHGEVRDDLLHAIVEDLEVLLLQARYGAVQRVAHGYRNQHQVGIDAQIGGRPFPLRRAGFGTRLDGNLPVEGERRQQTQPEHPPGKPPRASHGPSVCIVLQ